MTWLLMHWQRLALYAVLAASLLAISWLHGYSRGEIKLFEYKAEQAREAVSIIQKIHEVERIVTLNHTKREVEIQTVFVTVEKEVASVPSRPDCNITLGWLRLHDAAAESRAPEGRVDDPGDSRSEEHTSELQ